MSSLDGVVLVGSVTVAGAGTFARHRFYPFLKRPARIGEQPRRRTVVDTTQHRTRPDEHSEEYLDPR